MVLQLDGEVHMLSIPLGKPEILHVGIYKYFVRFGVLATMALRNTFFSDLGMGTIRLQRRYQPMRTCGRPVATLDAQIV